MDVEQFAKAVTELASENDVNLEDFVTVLAGLAGSACVPAADTRGYGIMLLRNAQALMVDAFCSMAGIRTQDSKLKEN